MCCRDFILEILQSSDLQGLSVWITRFVYIFVDFLIAILLMFSAHEYNKHPTFSSVNASSKSASGRGAEDHHVGEVIFCMYLLNPWTVITCVALSTIIFNNLAVALCLYAALKGRSKQIVKL